MNKETCLKLSLTTLSLSMIIWALFFLVVSFYRFITSLNITILDSNYSYSESYIENSPNVMLKLSLIGTITGLSQEPIAIIKHLDSGTPEFYKVGNMIEGFELKSIFRKHVILVSNNQNYILPLNDANTMSNKNP